MTAEAKETINPPSAEEIALFQAIADPKKTEITELLAAWEKRSPQIFNRLLLAAINADKTTIVAQLLNSGAEPNFIDPTGDAPLHAVARTGNTQIAGLLIAKRTNMNLPNADGNTPLHVAAIENKSAMVKVFLRVLDIKPNSLNSEGKTAAQVATSPATAKIITDAIAAKATRLSDHFRDTSPLGSNQTPSLKNPNDEKTQASMVPAYKFTR